jgi:hypothetical protein
VTAPKKVPVWKPALHTLWQALAAALVVWFGANAADVQAVRNVAELERLGLSLALAVLAALLSVAKNLGKQYLPGLLHAKDNPAEVAEIDALIDSFNPVALAAPGAAPSPLVTGTAVEPTPPAA